ncbi:glycosyltransferase [Salinimicrobium xinjiangense]|uniref:glycosyltransferase n=1 Tax=Salinimicrobium xinjiangense TaxID=438596 RepID=UPI0004042290|nr:glycosyltransferase [Salinimicrobium xinjiangense]
MEFEFTIIVPLFNEEENLSRLEAELTSYLQKASIKTFVLFVNDGSTDDSFSIIRQISQRNSNFGFISFDKNYGLSAAIKAGINHASTPLIGYMDADLQTDPKDFELLLPFIKANDLVTGMRVHRQDSLTKKMSSLVANHTRRFFTNDGMEDTCCPLKIIKADYAKRIPMFRGLHRFLPAMILLQGGSVKQVPITHYPRIAGEAKFNFFNRLVDPFLDCFAYLWMKRNYINYKISQTNE